jgi:hypothetical protein
MFGPGTSYAATVKWAEENKYWDKPWNERAPLDGPFQQGAVSAYLKSDGIGGQGTV